MTGRVEDEDVLGGIHFRSDAVERFREKFRRRFGVGLIRSLVMGEDDRTTLGVEAPGKDAARFPGLAVEHRIGVERGDDDVGVHDARPLWLELCQRGLHPLLVAGPLGACADGAKQRERGCEGFGGPAHAALVTGSCERRKSSGERGKMLLANRVEHGRRTAFDDMPESPAIA
jgi:hypothetical protein